MDKDEARGRFAELAAGDEERINLAEAALLIAAEADARLDPRHYLHRFDALARQAGAALHTAGSPAEAVVRLNGFLYGKMGFAGNRDDYYDPRNSFLNEVLDRRLGIPITWPWSTWKSRGGSGCGWRASISPAIFSSGMPARGRSSWTRSSGKC